WPPYSYERQGNLTGVGVDLATMLFNELNIPVVHRITPYEDDMHHYLRRGYVDLLAGTVENQKYAEETYLVLPPFYEDSLAVVAPKHPKLHVRDWHDLMGQLGRTSYHNQISQQFNEFADDYLAVNPKGSLQDLFRTLGHSGNDYIVGSAQFLKVGMSLYGHYGNFSMLPAKLQSEDIFFAFSRNSPCKAYAPYFRARIAELKESGAIDALMKQHLKASKMYIMTYPKHSLSIYRPYK